MIKAELRKQMLELRNALPILDQSEKSNAIVKQLLQLPLLHKAKTIFSYFPFRSEVSLLQLHQILQATGDVQNHHRIALPRILSEPGKMEAAEYSIHQELEESKWGILQPGQDSVEIPPQELDVILVPGVAFDRKGNRMGYGGGYYDRYLLQVRKDAVKIGICFRLQLTEHIETADHDLPMDFVVTEDEVVRTYEKEEVARK